ncbi:MAG TPA: histidine kinase, partial [Amycolatopsis sp.]|nr:histidine kinase [Amycolatopsis sp.]
VGRSADGRFRLRLELPLPDGSDTGDPAPERKAELEGTKPIRRLLTLAFCLLFCLVVVHILLVTHDVWFIAFDTGCLAALLALQLAYFNRPTTRLRTPQSYALLFVQACLIYLPLIPMQQAWVSQPGLLVGCALLVLPPAAGWALFAVSNAAFVWIQLALGTGTDFVVFFTVSAVLSSLIVFGLIWLVRLATELDSTRRRLADMAVAEERLRFARDLHDLLGMTLSAITLKSELTSRILPIDRTKATEELTDILGLTRQALADVRSVASGHRELSLESESRSAQSILTAADVRVRVEMLEEELPVPVRTVLAVVLREAVTNVLRHSDVENCDISVRRTPDGVRLDIVNDGVGTGDAGSGKPPVPGKALVLRQDRSGSGIDNLSHRVANLGGTLTAGVEDDGRFRLRAVVPV